MVYNMSAIATNSSTGLLGFTQGVNEVLLGGYLGVLLLVGITVVIFSSYLFLTRDPERSFIATGFIAFTLALILRAVSLIGNIELLVTVIFVAATLAFKWSNN